MDQNEQVPNSYLEEENPQEDLRLLLAKYLRYWRWFILGVVVMLLLAFLYVRYTTIVYNTEGSIKILKDRESGMDLSGLEGGGSLFNLREVNLENEMEILKSRRLLDSVVHHLELTSTLYKVGNIKKNEIWGKEKPFLVKWIAIDSIRTKDFPVFALNFTSDTQFEIHLEEGEIEMQNASIKSGMNQMVQIGAYAFKVLPNPKYDDKSKALVGEQYLFMTVPEANAINSLQKQITIEPVGKQSEILKIGYEGSNKKKNEDIVNTLIRKFNMDGIRDKQLISQRTEEFVAERSRLLFKELDTVETRLVDYKKEGQIVSIESTAGQLFQKESESEKKRYEIATQLELTKAFKQELKKGEAYTLLPANLGIESSSINNLTEKYNETVFLRQERLVSSTPDNPAIIQIESKLNEIKSNILGSIGSYVKDLESSLKTIKTRESQSRSRLHGLPEQEKIIRSITRQQEVKERLYLFLLQKREEAALKYAITSPTIKLVDAAYSAPTPIAPKSKIIYLAALILGGLIPFGILYLKFIFDTKLAGREDVKRVLPEIPIVAEIPMIGKNDDKLVKANDHSVLAESFRMLRTNLAFIHPVKGMKNQLGKVVFVTSTIKGEGKTFTALNMAHTLAATKKKVLVIGADLRNPQTHTYYKFNKNEDGLTNYLVDPSLHYKELVHTGDRYFSNLDLIISGPIPPNPAELLINGRFEQILEEVRKDYDYVIVDTAPTLLVTDTMLISEYADVTVYMTKADYTDKRLLEHVKELIKTEKLKNVGIVINGVSKKSGYGYNYGYGYGYFEDKMVPIWKFWKR